MEAFCGEATDEESSLIGGPTLLKFVSTFREVRGRGSLWGMRAQGPVGGCARQCHAVQRNRPCCRRAVQPVPSY